MQCGGALVYNLRKASARIGTVQRDLPDPSGNAEETKWILKKTPKAWTDPTVLRKWAEDRGFVRPSGATRLGERVWSFQAEVAGTEQSFKFTSVEAMRGRSSGPSQADQPRKVSGAWRVPKPKKEDDEENESSVRPREIEVPGAKSQEGQGTGSCEDEAVGEAGGEWKTVSAAKRR